MKWLSAFIVSFSLLGCSNSPGYYRSPPDTCGGAPGCAASAVIDGVIYAEPAAKKCSEMTGEQREKCVAQVAAINSAIKKAQGN